MAIGKIIPVALLMGYPALRLRGVSRRRHGVAATRLPWPYGQAARLACGLLATQRSSAFTHCVQARVPTLQLESRGAAAPRRPKIRW